MNATLHVDATFAEGGLQLQNWFACALGGLLPGTCPLMSATPFCALQTGVTSKLIPCSLSWSYPGAHHSYPRPMRTCVMQLGYSKPPTGHHYFLQLARASPQVLCAAAAANGANSKQATGKRKKTHVFHFKEFSAGHGQAGMKIGTDSILLGSWADVSTVLANKELPAVLDVGTGSGVLALMVAQRAPQHTCIHAVDVDQTACQQAADNAAASPWASRVHVFYASFEALVQQWQKQRSGRSQPIPLEQQQQQQHPTAGQQEYQAPPAEGGAVASPDEQQPADRQVLQLQDWQPPAGGYKVIISNPPYFINSYLPPSSTGPQITTADVNAMQPQASTRQNDDADVNSSGTLEPSCNPDLGSLQVAPHYIAQTETDSDVEQASVQFRGQAAGGVDTQTRDSTNLQRAVARHVGVAGIGLTYEVLASGAAALLAPGGALFVVLPAQNGEAQRFQDLAEQAGLQMARVAHVYGAAEQDALPIRWLMKFTKPEYSQTLGALEADVQPEAKRYAKYDICDSTTVHFNVSGQAIHVENIVVNRTIEEKAALGFDRGAFVPTKQYVQLTKDYHSPAFVQKWEHV